MKSWRILLLSCLLMMEYSLYAQGEYCCCGTVAAPGCIINSFHPGDNCDSWCALIGSSNSGANAGYADNTCSGSPCAPLPVELMKFEGGREEDYIKLIWETSAEFGNEGFEIQRSDQNLEWQTIGYQRSMGNGQEKKTYRFLDENPVFGLNYYRLKQIDQSGNYQLSKSISVNLEAKKTIANIFPTLARDNLLTVFNEPVQTPISISIYDILGRNIIELRSEVQVIDISHLPVGQFILVFKFNNHFSVHRFSKVD